MADLTYEERLLLSNLSRSPREDHDSTPYRVLVNSGLARRIDVGQVEITAAGHAALTSIKES